MKIPTWVKSYYQKPFRTEITSPLSLFLHRAASWVFGIAYKVIHYKSLRRSAIALGKIKAEVLNNRKSAFVFANGPSLSDIDLIKIKSLVSSGKFDLIAINSFLSKSIGEIEPTFAVFADNLHFNATDVDSQYSRDVAVCREKSIKYFVPVQHVDTSIDLQIGYNAFSDIFSSNTSCLLEAAGYYGVTAFHALRLAIQLGYKEIYICGFDNSYFKDFGLNGEGRLVIRHRHYYDGEDKNIEVPSVYKKTSEFFFDTYRHFFYLEKILGGKKNVFNIAKNTYLSEVERCFDLDVYKVIDR